MCNSVRIFERKLDFYLVIREGKKIKGFFVNHDMISTTIGIFSLNLHYTREHVLSYSKDFLSKISWKKIRIILIIFKNIEMKKIATESM